MYTHTHAHIPKQQENYTMMSGIIHLYLESLHMPISRTRINPLPSINSSAWIKNGFQVLNFSLVECKTWGDYWKKINTWTFLKNFRLLSSFHRLLFFCSFFLFFFCVKKRMNQCCFHEIESIKLTPAQVRFVTVCVLFFFRIFLNITWTRST